MINSKTTLKLAIGSALLALTGMLVVYIASTSMPVYAQTGPIAPTFGALPLAGTAVPAPTLIPVAGAPITPGAVPTSPTLPPTAIVLPTLHSDMMGIQVHADLKEEQWRLMMDFAQFMGMKWIKIQVPWREVEPQPGQYSALDARLKQYIQLAQGRNQTRILVSVAKAPDWARPAGAQGDGPPAQPKQLADFIAALIPRYGLRNQDAIEIWNEPNTQADWMGVPMNPATYLKYFDAAYKAVRSVSGMTVITAGLSPTGDGDDRTWLQQMYDLGLLRNYPDVAIGVHPYGWANPADSQCCLDSARGWDDNRIFFFRDTLDDYRQIMLKNGHQNGKLWATEFGWSSFDGLRAKDHMNGPNAKPPSNPDLAWMSQISQPQRDADVLRAFDLAQNDPNYASFMGPMMLWNLNFASLPGYTNADQDSKPEAGFSVLNGDGFPRSLYDLLQAAPKK